MTKVNPDKLRRRIGYVIQQIGLFPHMTIADNIATVPKMLGWDKKRISDRTDELLETVGIDLSYRDRYPKELSGGQRQRIGVARAMAADPPVLLMDEPFGAIDPITRDRLQDEFLRLQQEIRKTIVFVTHDIDEAIKMGDRIAILKQQSKIAQYDTPEKILTDPADDFVADFIGGGASIKRLSLSTGSDIETCRLAGRQPHRQPRTTCERRCGAPRRAHVLLLDEQETDPAGGSARRTSSTTTPPSKRQADRRWPSSRPARACTTTLDTMITSYKGSAIVVDEEGRYQGVVDFDTVLEAINAMRPTSRNATCPGEEQTRDRAEQDLQTGDERTMTSQAEDCRRRAQAARRACYATSRCPSSSGSRAWRSTCT